jgi:predicted tellurium resistance membrane protein TerC
MTPDILTDDQIESVQQIAVTANEKMDSGSLGNATQALNLGCTLAFIPGIIFVFLVLFLSRFNWAMAAITLVLVALAAMVFANLVSTLSRKRSIERIYHQEVEIEINNHLAEAGINRDQFDEEIINFLPANAPLVQMISESKKNIRRTEQ